MPSYAFKEDAVSSVIVTVCQEVTSELFSHLQKRSLERVLLPVLPSRLGREIKWYMERHNWAVCGWPLPTGAQDSDQWLQVVGVMYVAVCNLFILFIPILVTPKNGWRIRHLADHLLTFFLEKVQLRECWEGIKYELSSHTNGLSASKS